MAYTEGHKRFFKAIARVNNIHLGLADKLLIKKLVFEQTPYLGFRQELAKKTLLDFGYESKRLEESYRENVKLRKVFADYMLDRCRKRKK